MARILITSAIPYINGIKHLGNLVGSQLPADLFARFNRAMGHEVVESLEDGAGHLWASDRKQTTILKFDKPSRNGEHPTMKPVAKTVGMSWNSRASG